MRRDDQRQAVKNIPLEQLKPFKNHPFQVRDDEEFRRLVESIEIHGVIHPAVARQIGEDCYELISGHRRKAACEVLGYSEMPVLVRSMTDDEAVVNMVDANLQRETILPSERAFAYKMKLVAMSHQGRKGFTSAQLGRKCVGKESRELIAEQVGQSRNQISRYIRLTELIPEILEMVDNRKMALNPAVSISYLDKKQQKLLYKVMVALKATPSISQAKAIREKASESDFTEDYLVCILSEKKPNQREPMIVEEEEIKQYFPSHYSKKFREEHEEEILLHQAAKNAFDEMGVKKLPKVKELQTEYAKLLEEKKKTYAEYRRSREEMRELLTAKANVDRVLKMEVEQDVEKEKDHGQR